MIRLSIDERPLDWHTVTVRLDEKEQPMRVRYHLLPPEDAAARSAVRLRIARAVSQVDQAQTYDLLLERLDPEEISAQRDMLAQRIIEWDLANPDGSPLPVNAQTLGAVLGHGAFLRPLYDGLVDASLGAASKNG